MTIPRNGRAAEDGRYRKFEGSSRYLSFAKTGLTGRMAGLADEVPDYRGR